MKRTILISMTLIFLNGIICEKALSWDDGVTHKDFSEYAAYSSFLRKCENETDINCDYLKKLGFNKGLDKDELKWNENTTIKKGYIKDWLREGAMLEDAGTKWDAFTGKARFNNHFHNPLKPWSEAGLDDWVGLHYTGESSLLWAQDGNNQQNIIEGDWFLQRMEVII